MTTKIDTMELEPGELVEGKYRIVELIAEGGMGRLYRATQEPLGRDVALKLIKLEGADQDRREKWQGRFFREAKLASRLNHPNTVTVIDYGDVESLGLFLVMEYLDGVSLRDTLNHYGSLDVDLTVHIAAQIANSLADAHEAGIVHRDLKPPNVMLMRRGDDPCFVKVVDFGLVKELDANTDDELTGENALVGSPTYMAPERFLEKDSDSPAVDIYALGVVMYEMLVGRAPFVRGEKSTLGNLMMQHVNDDPPTMNSFKPGMKLPDGLEPLIMRCLAKNPEDRFESMDYVLRLLRSCQAAISDRPSSKSSELSFDSAEIVDAPEDRSSSSEPHRLPIVPIIGVVIFAIAFGIGAFFFFAGQPQRVQVLTTPTGAQVFDGDGVLIGVSPLVVDRDEFPTTAFKITRDGFEPLQGSIPESGDDVVKLELSLSPLPAPVSEETDGETERDESVEKPEPKTEVDNPDVKTDKPKPKKPKPIDIKLTR